MLLCVLWRERQGEMHRDAMDWLPLCSPVFCHGLSPNDYCFSDDNDKATSCVWRNVESPSWLCPGIESPALGSLEPGTVISFYLLSFFFFFLMGYMMATKYSRSGHDYMPLTLWCLTSPHKQYTKEPTAGPLSTLRTEHKAQAGGTPTGSGGPPREKSYQAAMSGLRLRKTRCPGRQILCSELKEANEERRAMRN